jgi:hypothetical protein
MTGLGGGESAKPGGENKSVFWGVVKVGKSEIFVARDVYYSVMAGVSFYLTWPIRMLELAAADRSSF